MLKVFYSWQSDLPGNSNRHLIEKALQRACSQVVNANGVAVDVVVDRDTLGASGAVDIRETILQKIADCDIFVGDVTPVAGQEVARSSPNPNVLVETGYAISQLGVESLVLVCNEYFGRVGSLPFDLRGLRMLPYTVSPEDKTKAAARDQLQQGLLGAISSIAQTVRSDPVYEMLHRYTMQITGQAEGALRELIKIAGTPNIQPSLAISSSELLQVFLSVNPNGPSNIMRPDGTMMTVLGELRHWRQRSRQFFLQLQDFSTLLKPRHLVLSALVEHCHYFVLVDTLPDKIGNKDLSFMAPNFFSYLKAARELREYAEGHLARRAGQL